MTHITRNLVAVKVPEEAHSIKNAGYDDLLEYRVGLDYFNIELPRSPQYRFLGLCTSSGPEFEKPGVPGVCKRRNPVYCENDCFGTCWLSLMQSAGCYFENPLGSKPTVYDDPHTQYGGSQMDDLAKWEKAQSQSSPKWAILEKIV